MPAISVVVPVYKAEKYLAACVDSILAQTVSDIEVILVNDGSTDASPAICDAYAEKDARVRVIHKENAGVTSARKAGIAVATAPFVGFVDADDYITPNMYQVMLSAGIAHNADLVECGYRQVENGPEECFALETGRVLTQAEIVSDVLTPLLNETGVWNCFLVWSCCNKIYNTHTLQQAMQQDDESIAIGEDMLQNILYLPHCKRAVLLAGECNYYYRRSDTSVMRAKSVHLGEVAYLQRAAACAPKIGYTGEGMRNMIAYHVVHDLLTVLFYSPDMPTSEKLAMARKLMSFVSDKTYFAQHCEGQGLPTKVCLNAVATGFLPLQWLVIVGLGILKK